MMDIFTSDGKMDMTIIMRAAMDRVTSGMNYVGHTWIVPNESQINMLPGGLNIIESTGTIPLRRY